LIINHSLDAGTVLPYVKRAQKLGYEVIITNTNDNYRGKEALFDSRSPEEHAYTAWKTFVQPANAETIVVVAHSYGGHVVCDLGNNFPKDFKERVIAVAFTDSVHYVRSINKRVSEIGMNFVASDKPLGTPVDARDNRDMPRVSAGHTKHEMTSYSCIDALFEFVQKRFEAERGGSPDAKKAKTNEL